MPDAPKRPPDPKLRRRQRPTEAELDRLAEVTPEHIANAERAWRAATPLLDAEPVDEDE